MLGTWDLRCVREVSYGLSENLLSIHEEEDEVKHVQ